MHANDILKQIEACDDPRRLKTLVARMEDAYTPLDFADALERCTRPLNDHPLGRTIIGRQLSKRQPERYRASVIAEGITLFSDPDHPHSGKTLVLGWTGRASRLGLPTVSFMQMLPSQLFDLAVLRDHLRQSYERGIEGYTDSLPTLVSRISTDLKLARYARVTTFGTSSGGFPALRAAHLLSAERGISVGGLRHWHIPRLLAGASVMEAPAYDVLCACRPRSPARLIVVYGEDNERDRRHADVLATFCPIERIPIPALESHGVMFALRKVGRAQPFLRHVLSFRRTRFPMHLFA